MGVSQILREVQIVEQVEQNIDWRQRIYSCRLFFKITPTVLLGHPVCEEYCHLGMNQAAVLPLARPIPSKSFHFFAAGCFMVRNNTVLFLGDHLLDRLGARYMSVQMKSNLQNEDRQRLAMVAFGVPERNIILDKQSGKDFVSVR